MKLALVLGGASCVWNDIERFKLLDLDFDGVFACNDVGADWPWELDGWISLHPEKYLSANPKWVEQREKNGFAPAKKIYAHRIPKDVAHPEDLVMVDYMFPGQKKTGSSGLFAAKVAMIDHGFDRVVFCGVPMTFTPHFFDEVQWKSAEGFRRQWPTVQRKYLDNMRSMSGWTKVLLGSPDDWAGKGTENGRQEDPLHRTDDIESPVKGPRRKTHPAQR